MNRNLLYYIAICITGSLFGLWAMGPAAFSKTFCHDDSRTNAYWAFPPAYGDFFRPDDITAHFRRTYADPIPKALYLLSGRLIDPLFMPTLFGLAASALTALFAFLFGQRLVRRADPRPWLSQAAAGAFALACLTILWQKGRPLCGVGNGGDFLVPLLLATLLGIERRSAWIAGLALFVSAGTYQSAFLLCFTLAFLSLIRTDEPRPWFRKEILLALVAGVASILIFRAGGLLADADPVIGRLRTAGEMAADPIFHFGGRHPIWMGNWLWTFIIGYQGGLGFCFSHLAMIGCLLILLPILRRKFGPVHPALVRLFFASAMLYALAWSFLPVLFFPSRYVRGALPIFLVGAVITGLAHGIHDRKNKVLAAGLAGLCMLLVLYPSIGHYRYNRLRSPELFQIISTLPADSLIAGHPRQMDDVVYFGRRSVLTSDEALMPVFSEYHRLHSARMNDLFDALYADREEEALAFCRKYGVTHLLLDRGLFVLDKKGSYLPYVKPYGSKARAKALLHYDRWALDREHFPGELYSDKYRVLAPCDPSALFGSAISESHP